MGTKAGCEGTRRAQRVRRLDTNETLAGCKRAQRHLKLGCFPNRMVHDINI